MNPSRRKIFHQAGVGVCLLLFGCSLPLRTRSCQENPAQRFVREINEVRDAAGVNPVWPNPLLAQAAQGHAEALSEGRAEGHFGIDGSDPLQRITAEGYLPLAFGENVAFGGADPGLVVEAWLRSPAHREVLLDPSVHEVGLGGMLSLDRPIWVANFGSGREEATERCHPWPVRR